MKTYQPLPTKRPTPTYPVRDDRPVWVQRKDQGLLRAKDMTR
jgi:hypothetical protein